MKTPLDFEKSFDASLLYWLNRFVRYKLSSLSNRQVTDKDKLLAINTKLRIGAKSIYELKELSKEARNAGLIGINTFITPLEKLYEYLVSLGFGSLKEIDEETLVDFLSIATSSLSDASKKNHRIALLSFFNYIDKQNEDDAGLTYRYGFELKNWAGITGNKGVKLPAYMADDEVRKFIEAIDKTDFGDEYGERNRLLIKIILYTGIRVGEALSLKKSDITPNEDVYIINVIGKGNKPRVVIIKRKYIEQEFTHWSQTTCKKGLLFCNKEHTMLSQSYVSRIMGKILLTAGVRKTKNGAHMLRHTFATMLYKNYHDIVLVKEALGHASTNTSMIYTHFDKERLRSAASVLDDLSK